MGPRTLAWRIDATQRGQRLDHILAPELSRRLQREITRAQARRLIEGGAVRCDGRLERRASFKPAAGTHLEVCFGPAALEPVRPGATAAASAGIFTWSAACVRFEDAWLLAVDKPPGLPTQPTVDARRASLFSSVQAWLRARDGADAYLGLHHRLDRDTSGLVLFTKDRRANVGVAGLFAGKTLRKTYQALAVAGPAVADAWTVDNHLGPIGRERQATRYGAVRSGGDPARTEFRILERLSGALLVEARPLTGRTHQIRVHLAEGGHAILGDTHYGGPAQLRAGSDGAVVTPPRVMLHAARLEFVHPMTGAVLDITSPLPADFAACLQGLRPTGPARPAEASNGQD
jgi:23S rRNA pseudouridine955/2504/2580 synthase